MPYTIDVLNRPREHAGVPTLAEMTAAALKSLAGRGDGFLLQVEGGRIDHAAHANDAGAMLWDQLAFDDAVAIALAFARSRDDTLVVVTTDHGNANPGLNGMGGAYSGSTECFERLLGAKTSFTALHSELRDLAEGAIAPADVADLVKDRLGVTLEPDEAGAVAEALNTGSIDEVNRQHRGIVGALGQAVGNHTGIGWTGITHTNELGLTLASGPGSAHFGGIMHHVRVFDILCRLMGIEHENPSMTADQAKRHLSSAPILRDVCAI
jgi:alkaline phosphatase